jgi:hypothetical protein
MWKPLKDNVDGEGFMLHAHASKLIWILDWICRGKRFN